METIGFWLFDHLSTRLFLQVSYTSYGFGANLIIQRFTDCFDTLFLNLGGTHARCPRVTNNCP